MPSRIQPSGDNLMRRSTTIISLATIAVLAASQGVNAAMLWDESVSGDLSGDGLAPTLLTLGAGSNQIVGTTGNGGLGVDLDYFTFTLSAGQTLTSIRVLSNTLVSGDFSFLGLQAGPQVTVSPSGAGSQALLGWTHYRTGDAGFDLLPRITASGVLPAGTYAVWIQDTGGPADYGFDFGVTSVVPLPPSLLLLTSTLVGLGGIFRRRISTG